ncbi:MAG: phage tail protein [Alteromonadaceae bacterium]|nr:phage tail protein [Alteromonadaceae bacterium]
MATEAKFIQDNYPLPVYRFTVSIGDETMSFSEVSGLDIEYQAITYKDGLGVKHMPGQPTETNITLKRGIVRAKSQLYDWINSTSLNLIDKRDITISLVDNEAQTILITWTIKDAFPTKLTAPTMDANSNEVAVETLELRADDVKIAFS